MAKRSKPQVRWLLVILGASLLLWGLALSSLGFFGALSDAEVLEISPVFTGPADELLKRVNIELNKLTYAFTSLEKGKVQGVCIRFKSMLSLQAFALLNPSVRYFEFFPMLNAFEYQTGLSLNALAPSLAGLLLLVLSPRRKKKRQRQNVQ